MTQAAHELRRQNHPLPTALSAAVPLRAMRLCEHPLGLAGVFDKREMEALQDRIGEAGEAILYRVPGKSADGFNALAEAIARLAFSPGGVRCFGLHFEYEIGKWFEGKHGVPERDAPASPESEVKRVVSKFRVVRRKG